MTLEQLETLLKRAEDVLGHKLQMSKLYSGKWSIHIHAGPICNDFQDATLDECIAKLKQWATPPKPKTLTFTLPTDYCEAVLEDFSRSGKFEFRRGADFHKALVAALAPYQQPE